MRIAYFDCIGGASGDMLLGSLLDIGLSPDVISASISDMNLSDCSLKVNTVMKGALSATKVNIITPQKETHRHLTELLEIINSASISESVREKAEEILMRIGKIEAGIHGSSLDKVHLHEVGGDDALIDIVGVLSGLEALEIEEVYVSSLPLARGWVNSAHGRLPLPAPATLALLKGVPVHYLKDVQAELVTPTGAALLTSIANSFGGFPEMELGEIGTGAGKRDLPFPNVVRLWLGEAQEKKCLNHENLVMLETNIDNMSSEIHGYLMESLLHAGLLDITFTPIQMKKNRPAIQINLLCRPDQVQEALNILYSETTTLGVRQYNIERTSLPRRFEIIDTPYGPIQMKIATWNGKQRARAEYEDCKQAATKYDIPIMDVISAAEKAYSERINP